MNIHDKKSFKLDIAEVVSQLSYYRDHQREEFSLTTGLKEDYACFALWSGAKIKSAAVSFRDTSLSPAAKLSMQSKTDRLGRRACSLRCTCSSALAPHFGSALRKCKVLNYGSHAKRTSHYRSKAITWQIFIISPRPETPRYREPARLCAISSCRFFCPGSSSEVLASVVTS